MHIAGLNYYLNRSSLEIFFQGCKEPHCISCHNPELQAFNLEDNIQEYKEKIKTRIQTGMINKVELMGGEPLDQPLDKLEELILFIKNVKHDIKIWLWTGYDEFYDKINFIHLLDYVKFGKYIEELPEYIDKKTGILLASSNQKIVKL